MKLENRRPLGVQGLYDLLQDARRSIVLPHRIVPVLVDLHRTVAQMFDAVYATTSDSRWLEAAELVRRAANILRDPRVTVDQPPPLERGVFEGRSSIARKGMAMVRAAKRVRRR